MESVRKRLEAAEKIHSQKQNIIQELQTQVTLDASVGPVRDLKIYLADGFVETKENFRRSNQ